MVLYKRRRNSLRLANYDYRQPGCYYITINTHDKRFIFNCKDYCQIAEKHIESIQQKFKLIIENSVVMATHVHLLFTLMPDIAEAKRLPLMGGSKSCHNNEIYGAVDEAKPLPLRGGNKSRPYGKDDADTNQGGEGTHRLDAGAHPIASSRGEFYTRPLSKGEFYTRPLKISVSKIVASLKAGIWHDLRKIGFVGKLWQRAYYDHIIRSEEDLMTHWYYIEKNKYQKGEEVDL